MSKAATCPVCSGTDVSNIFSLGQVPVICNQLWPDEATARNAAVGDVDLSLCNTCAFIWNRSFDPARMSYEPGYENALHHSAKFQAFASNLAEHLVSTFDLAGKCVVEIGCGDGHMLNLLVRNGAARAVGFDPSMEDKHSEFAELEGVEIVPEYFGPDALSGTFDAITCRHVLEHLDAPMSLLETVRTAIADRTDLPMYFEVPNAKWMLDAVSLWDVIYEHFGYWSAPAMETAMVRAGFRPASIKAGYDDQFLMVEAWPDKPDVNFVSPDARAVVESAKSFAERSEALIAEWCEKVGQGDQRAVIWGAGSKGITFANIMGGEAARLAALVDLNPRKHGLYAPGIGLPVVAPDALTDIRPDVVFVSNGLYKEEIAKTVADLGVQAECVVVAG